MKKSKLSLLLLPLFLTSCIVDSSKGGSSFGPAESSESSLSSSYDFGSDPTSLYQKEDADFVRCAEIGPYRVRLLFPNGDIGITGPTISLAFDDSWVDVEVVGQKDVVKTTCMFCPQIDLCRNAVFYGDQEDLYD